MNINNILHFLILYISLIVIINISLNISIVSFILHNTYMDSKVYIKFMSKLEKNQLTISTILLYILGVVSSYYIMLYLLSSIFPIFNNKLLYTIVFLIVFAVKMLEYVKDDYYKINMLYKNLITSEKNFYFRILNKYFKCTYIDIDDSKKLYKYTSNVYSNLFDGEFIFNYVRKNRNIVNIVDGNRNYVTFDIGLYVVTILKYCNIIVIMDKDKYIENLSSNIRDRYLNKENKMHYVFSLEINSPIKDIMNISYTLYIKDKNAENCLLNLLYNIHLKKHGDTIDNYPHNSAYIKKYKEQYKFKLNLNRWNIDIKKVKSEIYSLYVNKIDGSFRAKNFILNASDIILKNNEFILKKYSSNIDENNFFKFL